MKNVNIVWIMSLLLITLVQSYACIPPAITAIFKSDDEPPQISNVTLSGLDKKSAIVNWVTDEPATGRIVVSDGIVCWALSENATLTINHQSTLDLSGLNLKCNKNYEIVIFSSDANGNQSQYEFSKTLISCRLAPDFTLVSLNGQPVSLSDFKGKNVLLNFWSYWCSPCTRELPLFQSFYSVLPKDKLELITISVGDDITGVNNYIIGKGYKFPVLFDSDGTVDKIYNNRGLPTSYLISSEGYVLDKRIGPFDGLDDLRKFTGTLY